ncbi:MAG: DUF6092 family protein [Candidatus Bathyarchaeia archaeon]|jgi:hypothetical protein
MDTHKKDELEREFFELICYMVTSARNLIEENKLYGPLRLVDAVSRLVDVLEKLDLKSPRLETIQGGIKDGEDTVMESEEKFNAFLENLVMDLVPLMQDRK